MNSDSPRGQKTSIHMCSFWCLHVFPRSVSCEQHTVVGVSTFRKTKHLSCNDGYNPEVGCTLGK